MTCRGKGQWQKAKEVCHQDEHEHCHDVWEVNDTVFAGHIFNHFIHQAIGQFGNRLATCRHQGPTTRAKYLKRNNGQDCETHPKGHIAVTAVLALAVFLAVTVLGFVKNGFGFLSLFWISSAPLILRPILALIEVISYFVRPVSHSIRLAGNMMAGHAVIKVFAAFAPLVLISTGIGLVVTPLSILAITAIYALEVLVAFIQAYVFAILTCVYLRDALHPHH